MSVDFWKKEMSKITNNREVLDREPILSDVVSKSDASEQYNSFGITRYNGQCYFMTNGNFIGKEGTAPYELRIIDIQNSEISPQYQSSNISLLDVISLVDSSILTYTTLPIYNGISGNFKRRGTMSLSQLLDLIHVMYGEQKGNYASDLAHVLYNREIKYAKKLFFDEEENMKIFERNTLPDLRQFDYLGETIFDYSLATLHVPYPEKATPKKPISYLRTHLNVMRQGLPAIETDPNATENLGYRDFYQLKASGISTLLENAHTMEWASGNITDLIKATIQARLGLTNDPRPNYTGWIGTPITWLNGYPHINSES
jgi:hypothetical protein